MKHIIYLLIVTQHLFGAHPHHDPLEGVLEQVIQKHDIPAMAVQVILEGKVVGAAAVGVRVRGGDTPVTLDDNWHLGSCTKAMTATLAARLVEQKIIGWDSTIAGILPDLVDTMHPSYLEVTLRDLLTHRSGLLGTLGGTEVWKNAFEQNGTPAEQQLKFVAGVLQLDPVGPVGKYVYSNAGYTVAGYMCAVAAGTTYENLMQREIFTPLNMTTAGYGAPLTGGPNHPNGHIGNGKPSPPLADNPIAITPAGRVHCSIADWGKFIGAHLVGEDGKSDLLDAASFAELHTPVDAGDMAYAMGWLVSEHPWGDGPVLIHSGSNTMWYCSTWVAPKRGIAVLVACNQGGQRAEIACTELIATCVMDELARMKKLLPSTDESTTTQ